MTIASAALALVAEAAITAAEPIRRLLSFIF
jgi:hypothetical protein